MNEELDSQLSAMFDDELPEDECELLARRLARGDDCVEGSLASLRRDGRGIRAERRRADAVLAGRSKRISRHDSSARASSARTRTGETLPKRLVVSARGHCRGRWRGSRLPVLRIARGRGRGLCPWIRPAGPHWRWKPGPRKCRRSGRLHSARPDNTARELRRTCSGGAPIVPSAELANYVVAHSEFSAPVNRRNIFASLPASR